MARRPRTPPITPAINTSHLADLIARANLRAQVAELSKLPPAKAKQTIMWRRHPLIAMITDEQAEFLIFSLGLEHA